MSGKAVRQHFMKEFRTLSRNSDQKAVVMLSSYIAQVVAAVGIGCWLIDAAMTGVETAAVTAAALFIATRLRGVNNIMHECSHFSFAESRQLNMLCGRICAAVLLNCFRDYREEHMSHHSHLGDYENDLDFQRLRSLRLEDPLTTGTLLRHALTALSGLHLSYYVSINLRAGDGEGFRILKLSAIASATAFLLVSPLEAVVLIWLPFLWLYPSINYLTDCIDHGGLVEAGDELEASRNLPVPLHARVLLFPRNDCYHLVHHLFPQVPVRHLGDCHTRLLSHPDYRARTEVPVLGSRVTDRAAGPELQRQGRYKVRERTVPLEKQFSLAAGFAK